jgi:acyl-[acyl-carrier-protein] desaturase
MLPSSESETFFDEVKDYEIAKDLPYDFVLVGDTITEEALPTYESCRWTSMVLIMWSETRIKVDCHTSENRHGDLPNGYLY